VRNAYIEQLSSRPAFQRAADKDATLAASS
jgi:hypothetical protein